MKMSQIDIYSHLHHAQTDRSSFNLQCLYDFCLVRSFKRSKDFSYLGGDRSLVGRSPLIFSEKTPS
jgi:hypothetical protein